MIILITGATHTDKTALAQRLMGKYKIPYLSIDLLKMWLIRSDMTNLTPEDDEELTAYLWPIMHEIIRTAMENGQSLIIEGYYIPAQGSTISTMKNAQQKFAVSVWPCQKTTLSGILTISRNTQTS